MRTFGSFLKLPVSPQPWHSKASAACSEADIRWLMTMAANDPNRPPRVSGLVRPGPALRAFVEASTVSGLAAVSGIMALSVVQSLFCRIDPCP